MGRGTSGSNPTARSQKGSKMSYLSFVKERPVLYGNIVVNGVGNSECFDLHIIHFQTKMSISILP